MFKPLYNFRFKNLYLILTLTVPVILSYNGNLIAAGISASVCGAFFAVLLLSDCDRALLIPLPVLTAGAVWLAAGDGFKAFISLFYLPVGIVLAYSAVKKKSVSQTVVSAAVVLGVFYVMLYAAHIIYAYGSLTTDTIKAYVNLFFGKVTSLIKKSNDTYVLSDGRKLFSDEALKSLMELIRYSFAGIYLSALLIASFAANAVFKRSVMKIESGSDVLDTVKAGKLIISKQAGIVFIVLYVISLLASDLPPYMQLSLTTLSYPIQLGLIYTGLCVFGTMIKAGRISVFGIVIIVVGLFVYFSSFIGIILSLATLIGLITVLRKKPPQVNKKS